MYCSYDFAYYYHSRSQCDFNFPTRHIPGMSKIANREKKNGKEWDEKQY